MEQPRVPKNGATPSCQEPVPSSVLQTFVPSLSRQMRRILAQRLHVTEARCQAARPVPAHQSLKTLNFFRKLFEAALIRLRLKRASAQSAASSSEAPLCPARAGVEIKAENPNVGALVSMVLGVCMSPSNCTPSMYLKPWLRDP